MSLPLDLDRGMVVADHVPRRLAFGFSVTVTDQRPVGKAVFVDNRPVPDRLKHRVVVASDGDDARTTVVTGVDEVSERRASPVSRLREGVKHVARKDDCRGVDSVKQADQSLPKSRTFAEREGDRRRLRPTDMEVRKDESVCLREIQPAVAEDGRNTKIGHLRLGVVPGSRVRLLNAFELVFIPAGIGMNLLRAVAVGAPYHLLVGARFEAEFGERLDNGVGSGARRLNLRGLEGEPTAE